MVRKRRREMASDDYLLFLLFDMHYVPEILDILSSSASCEDHLTRPAHCLGSREEHSK
jgi:hypothetical protein